MNDAVKRADIITALLHFSRATEVKKAPENLNSIIETSLWLVRQLLDKYHIEVIKELGKDIFPLNLDKSRMEQVFLNLFLNAVDAMLGGGQIKVRTYKEEVTEVEEEVGSGAGDIFRQGETMVIAEVEDTGTGVPEDILDKISAPFFTTKQGKGERGLWLSVAKNIVEMHKGKIKIENRRDRSGVRVTLMFKA